MVNVIGEVEGMRALIVDDEIDTGTTIINAAEALQDRGVTEIDMACTHAIFSGDAVKRVQAAGFGEVVVTDTIPLPAEKRWPQVSRGNRRG